MEYGVGGNYMVISVCVAKVFNKIKPHLFLLFFFLLWGPHMEVQMVVEEVLYGARD